MIIEHDWPVSNKTRKQISAALKEAHLQGMREAQEIVWAERGFPTVEKAYNAIEARISALTHEERAGT